MKTSWQIVFCLVILYSNIAFCQSNDLSVNFDILFGNQSIYISDSAVWVTKGDTIRIQSLKFYVSNIRFTKQNKEIFKDPEIAHLLDASNPKSLNLMFNLPTNLDFDILQFDLGIDSLTNVSGALGNDLDPTNGMYWSWQSGYINFKLDGISKVCPTRNHEFSFHLGGYIQPYFALQKCSFKISNSRTIKLSLNLKSVLENLDLSKQNHIMSPNAAAVELSKIIANNFSVLAP